MLLESLEVPESAGPSQAALKKFMSGPLAECEAKWRYPDDGCLNQVHITLSFNDNIYELIKPMAEKEINLWTDVEVEAAATILGGWPSINARREQVIIIIIMVKYYKINIQFI